MIAKGQETQSSEFNTNIAIYPYQEGIGCTYVKGNDGTDDSYQITGLTFPQTQTYSPDSFSGESFLMAANTTNLEDHKLNFKNLCGIIKLQLKGKAKIKTIELCGNNNEKIAGGATVTLNEDGSNPQISLTSETSTIITLDCGEGVQLNEETATNFHTTVPPTNFEKGFRIKTVDIDGGITEFNTSKANSVRRSYIHTMPEVTLGGTGSTKELNIELGAISKSGQLVNTSTKSSITALPVI